MKEQGERPFLTAAEVGRLEGRSPVTIRRRIAKGAYPGTIFDGFGYLIPRKAHEDFLAGCNRLAPAPLSISIRKRVIDAGQEFSRAVRRMRDDVCRVERGAR